MQQPSFKFKKEGSILWWEWNDPHSSVNLISFNVLTEMENLISRLEKENIKVLVLLSGKPSNFIAGVDIKELQKINQAEEIRHFLEKFHSLFNRIEKLPIVKIAAIHGACLGGGLELTLTFDYRLASLSKETRLGLPETRIGLIPGLGGCVRLPRIINLKKSLKMILQGTPLPSEQALSIGLIDEALPQNILKKRAGELAKKAEQNFHLKKLTLLKKNKTDFYIKHIPFAAKLLFYLTKRKIIEKTKNLYPAPLAALNVIKKTYRMRDTNKALSIEQSYFLKLISQKENKNLMRVFFLIRKAKKKKFTSKNFNIKNIGVIGAGTMGSAIAYTCGIKDFSIRLMDNKEKALSKALLKIDQLWKTQLKRKSIDSDKALQISSALNYKDISQLDMVIEAIPEDLEIKKQAFQMMTPYINKKVIFASNTSSLSLKKMASFYPYPHRFLGMHFFNPVYKMPLVEVIKTDSLEATALERALEFVKKIGKVPIVVRDSPGFLVNRVLAPYLCEALWFLKEGYDIALVDQYFSEDFGLPMGPFQLMDEVGLDICLQVISNLKNAGLPLDIPDETVTLFSKIGTGRKDGCGFYTYAAQKPRSFFNKKPATVNRELKTLFRKKSSNSISSVKENLKRGIYLLINESFKVLEENIVESADDVDMAMILGTGFPPVYGGPLTYGKEKGLTSIRKKLEFWSESKGPRFRVSKQLKEESDKKNDF